MNATPTTRIIQAIDADLETAMTEYATGRYGWTSIHLDETGQASVRSSRSLYRGQLGIALYLGTRHAVVGEERYAYLARKAAEPWLSMEASKIPLQSTGGLDGVGALIYTATRLADSLNDDKYIDQAEAIIRQIDDDVVTTDQRHGVVYGNAGLLLALSAYLRDRTDTTAVRLAELAADHLLNETVSTASGLGWAGPEQYPATGFAHGSAGISYALVRISDILNEARYRKTAERALAFETDCYDVEAGLWTRHERSEAYGRGWCWGPSGIALSRAGIRDICEDMDVRHSLTRAAKVMTSIQTYDDCLCHGVAGDLSVLLSLRDTDIRQVESDPAELASKLIDRYENRGGFQFAKRTHSAHSRPGLMTGYAGIGYALQRFQNPELPSVLLLE